MTVVAALSYPMLNLSGQAEISPNSPSFRLHRNLEDFVGIENIHAPRKKGEVIHASVSHRDFTQQHALGIPDVNT